jgi:hypothetical protein
VASGIRTGAVNLETATSLLAKKVLSENASRRITVAKNEDSVGRVGVHQSERREAKALRNQNCRPQQPAGAQSIEGLVCLR